MACLNKVVAGELREFYVEGAALIGGVSGGCEVVLLVILLV